MSRLKGQLPDVAVDYDAISGSPKFIRRPAGLGRALKKSVVRRAGPANAPQDPSAPVREFLDEYAPLFGYGSARLAGARLDRSYFTPHNGMRSAVWEQSFEGIPIFEAVLQGHVDAQNSLVNVSSTFLSDPARAAGAGSPDWRNILAQPPISAPRAIQLAAENLRETVDLGDIHSLPDLPDPPGPWRRFQAPPLPGIALARRVWLPLQPSVMTLAWEVELTRPAPNERYQCVVDATSGEVILRRCRTFYFSPATYEVYTSDSPSPLTPGYDVPVTNQPPRVARSVLSLAALSPKASPNGWINDGDNETLGNNVDAHLDRNGDDQPDLPRPQGSPARTFRFPLDPTQDPSTYADAAVVQLFYWCNWMHDQLYDLGFTEAAGNFQKDNFGRGGLGNDPLLADAQDGSGFNNANFTPTRDGMSPRIQMFIFDGPNPHRDGDLDGEIILHEYTHGLSDRLVGGGVGISAYQTIGLAEGWSDFYALALLSEPDDDVHGVYPSGGYESYLFNGLTENYYFGIRRYPYTTDLAKNPLTFRDIDPHQVSPHDGVPLSPIFPFDPNSADNTHRLGEVWCTTLWDARANLIDKYGYAAGNRLILQLVTDGMKLSPPNPNFLQARDAILQADQVDTGGENQADLWRAFARRGMGVRAISGPSWSGEGIVESFALPDPLVIQPALPVTFSGPGQGPFTPGERQLVLTNSSDSAVPWQLISVPAWLDVSAPSGTINPGQAATLSLIVNTQANAIAFGERTDFLLFSNALSGTLQSRDVQLEVMDFALPPFKESFEDEDLGPWWTADGSGFSRLRLSKENGPEEGQQHLLLGSSLDHAYARNEVTLGLDLAGYTNVTLRFWAKGFQEQPDGPPALPFVDSADFDGVAISDDGVHWYEVQGLRPLSDVYLEYVVNLDAAVTRYGLSYNSHFRLRFNQYGNRKVPSGGIALDDVRVTGQSPLRFTLTLPATVGEAAGDLLNAGTVSVLNPPAADLTVNLSSAAPDIVGVPASVVIPAGGTNATFSVEVKDNAALDGQKSATIEAWAPAYVSGYARVIVEDDELAILSLSIPARAREGDRHVLTNAGRVAIDLPPVKDLIVDLNSSDLSELQVPAGVTIRAGETSASFDVTVVDDYEIDGPQVAIVTAHAEQAIDDIDATVVLDNEEQRLAVLVPSTVRSGLGQLATAGQIFLSGTWPSNLVVQLASDQTNLVQVPDEVLVEPGDLVAYFPLTIRDLPAQANPVVRITATAPGFERSTATLQLLADSQEVFPFIPKPADRSVDNPTQLNLSWLLTTVAPATNGDFENGDLTGWQNETTGAGRFVINDGSNDPPGPDGPLPPLNGRFSAYSEQIGPGHLALYRDIDVPYQNEPVVLEWTARIRNHAAAFATNQFFRVEIRDLDNSLLATAATTQPGQALEGDAIRYSYNLSGYKGRRIRGAFVVENHLGYLNVHLDDVRLLLGFPDKAVSRVYFGTAPDLNDSEILGATTGSSWALAPLAHDTTYYWKIVAQAGHQRRSSPVWRFTTQDIGKLDHFDWSGLDATQFVGIPFHATLTARDAQGHRISGFRGPVRIRADQPMEPGRLHVLAYITWADTRSDYRHTIGAIAAAYSNLVVTTTTTRDPDTLRAQLQGTDIFLVPEQNAAPAGTMGSLAETWTSLLQDYVRGGGTMVVCSYQKDEPLLLSKTGLLNLYKLDSVTSLTLTALPGSPLTEGVDASFIGQHVSTYSTTNGEPAVLDPTGYQAAVIHRSIGAGQVVLIGSDFVITRSPFDRILVNAVQTIWGPRRRPVELNPQASGFFTDGQWTGSFLAAQAGDAVVLTAGDDAGHSAVSPPFRVVPRDDLAVTVGATPDPISVGMTMRYTIQITNSGPATVSQAQVTSRFPDGLAFISTEPSDASASFANGTFSWKPGSLPANGGAALAVLARPDHAGLMTNWFHADGNARELYLENNRAAAISHVVVPSLYTTNVYLTEGNSGRQTALFRVSLTAPSSQTISCDFVTSNGTATAEEDYLPAAGTIVFAPGVTTQTIPVPVLGDRLPEGNEIFFIHLFHPTNAAITFPSTSAILLDDDPNPALAIGGATVVEGADGTVTSALFPVRLSFPSGQDVSAVYLTRNGTAVAPADYVAGSGMVRFPAGSTNQWISVQVRGDRQVESNETFTVELSNPLNATVETSSGTGTIVDDDAGVLDHFNWDPVAAVQLLQTPFQVRLTARDGSDRLVNRFDGTAMLTAFAGAREVSIGDNSNVWEYPFGTGFHDERLESIYLAKELGGPSRLTALALYVQVRPGQPLNDWTIRLQETSAERFVSPGWAAGEWETVYRQTARMTNSGWVWFEFERPFDFSGAKNLLVDFSFNNNSYSQDGLCRVFDTGQPRSLSFRTDSAFGDPRVWSQLTPPPSATSLAPCVKWRVEKPIALLPTTTDRFENGVWQGQVALDEIASGIALRANDAAGHTAVSQAFSITASNDLALTLTNELAAASIFQPWTYTLVVSNTGPGTAHSVLVQNPFATNLSLLSATASQGTCALEDGLLRCRLGDLAPAATASIVVTAESATPGLVTNTATVSAAVMDAYPGNDKAAQTIVILPQALSVEPAEVVEGPLDAMTNLVFTVRLSVPSTETVSVDYLTTDGTALRDLDYTRAAGTLVLPPGATNGLIEVQVLGDSTDEEDETLQLNLFNPTNAVLGAAQATGLIRNDDLPPLLSIDDVTAPEGNSGTSSAAFSVQLTEISGKSITVQYKTISGTAMAGQDFTPHSGTLLFPPTVTRRIVFIPILGDEKQEPDETFTVELSAPTQAKILRERGTGTILNDDDLPGVLHHFAWSAVRSLQLLNQPIPVTIAAKDTSDHTAPLFNGSVQLRAAVGQPNVTIGQGSSTWNFPLGTGYHDARTQVIYTTNEMGGARLIQGIALPVTVTPGQTLQHWTIRMKHTATASFPTAAWETNGWTQVYQADEVIPTTGWTAFMFPEPFTYNGTNHLMVDFSFNNDYFTSDGFCESTPASQTRSLSFQSDSDYGDPLTWNGPDKPRPVAGNNVPDIRFISETSYPLLPNWTGNFSNGVWRGQLVVPAPATNLVLTADDGQGHQGFSLPLTVAADLDSNDNGLPDAWETLHFGSLQLPGGSPDADPDGDGLSNLEEWKAGSDPTDPASAVRITSVQMRDLDLVLTFEGVPGRSYSVERTSDINHPTWVSLTGVIPGQGATQTITDRGAAGAPNRFYRIRLLP